MSLLKDFELTKLIMQLGLTYMKYLYPYECEKRRLSTPAELQAAIDGNRREGRRSSYGQYDSIQRSPNPGLQMTPLSLVSQQQQQQLAARMMSSSMSLHNGAHHPSHPQPMGQPMNGGPLPGLAPSEFEARMLEYMKLLNKEMRSSAATPPIQGDISPPNIASPLNPLRNEPINLSEPSTAVKRDPECRESPPPAKRLSKETEEPEPPKPLSPSTHIKINSRGDSRNGDNSLVVSMELNGVTYQGVLFAQSPTPTNSGRTALAS
ncbi:hypothetical protein NQ317_019124 [Molorchus minor]|uniref:REKLES domain-containing protein n=1 Tax=Molorchus minor TaxID=1323400 RepID=A0ABQ9J1Y1_9CUCU|nr:hypothetical protein NQ317_019124 [Molorchus minor]